MDLKEFEKECAVSMENLGESVNLDSPTPNDLAILNLSCLIEKFSELAQALQTEMTLIHQKLDRLDRTKT